MWKITSLYFKTSRVGAVRGFPTGGASALVNWCLEH